MPRRPKRKDSEALRKRHMRARRAEERFARQLRSLAKRCGQMAREMFDAEDPVGSSSALKTMLNDYARMLRPWARKVAERMVLDVERRDDTFWSEQSKLMGRQLKQEISRTAVGRALRERTLEAAALITSLPLEAAQRVEKLSVRMLTDSTRASELAKEILKTGEVTKSRANLIARTETSRTAGILLRTKAESIGSEGYIWRTANDIDVRKRHQRLAGKYFKWSDPPVTGEKGERSHPGGIYNCRCYAEVVLPEFSAEEVA